MKSWTHPSHGNPKSPSFTPKGPPLSNRRIDQLRREGFYGDKAKLAQEFQDSRKKTRAKRAEKKLNILGLDQL